MSYYKIPISSQNGFTISSTSGSQPSNIFDGDITTYYRSASSPSLPEYLTVNFPNRYKIVGYKISIGYYHPLYTNMKTWDFQGLVNGQWVTLHSGSNDNAVAVTLEVEFEEIEVQGIRIVCYSRHGYNSWGIDELEVYGKLEIGIGESLLYPEPGWKRYDDNIASIAYKNAFNNSSTGSYNNSFRSGLNFQASFDFIGSKIRIIAPMASIRSRNITITIDGVHETFSEYNSSLVFQALVYEKTGLSFGRHTVRIIGDSGDTALDAIDIDDTGRLLHPDEVTDVNELDIGKRIRCHYTALSNVVGTFSVLGKEASNFISPPSNINPNGDFYWICVDKDYLGRWKLIADRNIQNNISWDTLNNSGIASGSGIETNFENEYFSDVPIFSSYTANANGYTYRITYSGYLSLNYPYKAFNGIISSSSDYWSFRGKNGWIQIDMGRPVVISRYSLWGRLGYPGQSPKSWTLQASNIGAFAGEQVILHSANIENPYDDKKTFLINPNKEAFRFYRIVIIDNFGDIDTSVCEILFEQKVESPHSNKMKCTIRLLTGGISNTDKDNEWDKYIVNSDLNGCITPGDNDVWNWINGHSWTSTTHSSNASSRIVRGNSSVSYFGGQTSSYLYSSYGFRPVLLIEFLPSIKFEGSLDKTTIHNENVILSGTIIEEDGKDVQYRIEVNGVQVYPESGYTSSFTPPVEINHEIANSYLRVGLNLIRLYVTNGSNEVNFDFFVTLTNEVPMIETSMIGMKLNAIITDDDNDKVQYNVFLNGNKIYPLGENEYTEFLTPPISFSKLFKENEIFIGQNNVLTINVRDTYGGENTVTINFIGDYTGLMFMDGSGNYYSTNLGDIIKYLDFGNVYAGTTSHIMKVIIKNTIPNALNNIKLKKVYDENVLDIEISKTNNPFIPEPELIYDQVLMYGDTLEFYIRLTPNIETVGEKFFELNVEANPVSIQ